MALWGSLNMCANVTTQAAFQRWAPPDLIGRLSGVLMTTSYGMFPISVALAGVVARRYGPDAFFILAAVSVAGDGRVGTQPGGVPGLWNAASRRSTSPARFSRPCYGGAITAEPRSAAHVDGVHAHRPDPGHDSLLAWLVVLPQVGVVLGAHPGGE